MVKQRLFSALSLFSRSELSLTTSQFMLRMASVFGVSASAYPKPNKQIRMNNKIFFMAIPPIKILVISTLYYLIYFISIHPFQLVQDSRLSWRLRRLFLENGILVSQHSPLGNAIKLSGGTFLVPHRGSSPKGEARYYVANDSLNLIAFPSRGMRSEGADRGLAV